MKILKIIWYSFLGFLSAIIIFILLCAFNPKLTSAVAAFLYPDGTSGYTSGGQNPNRQTGGGQTSDGQPSGGQTSNGQSLNGQPSNGQTGGGQVSDGQSADGTGNGLSSDYVPPAQADIVIPENVSGRNGYQPVQEDNTQIADKEAEALRQQIGTGETGEGLTFDALYYPYYAMLHESGQSLYRQIYANALSLNGIFAPAQDISVNEIRNVFAAVYNDHPELFWLDTAYACKYLANGQCVEIDLQFNRTAQELYSAKAAFEQSAAVIVAGAQNLGSEYEKEKYVHDMLLAQVEYVASAEMNQSAYSALVNGRTVCAGYARAFQYLMQQLAVPCYYCTGFAGESHAWNIILLSDGYYNVDTTWDDTGAGVYDYFNKTDADYADTHIRQELSVYLPPCEGQTYRTREIVQVENPDGSGTLRSLADVGKTESDVLSSMQDYYADCYNQIVQKGSGAYTFSNVIGSVDMLQKWYEAYETEAYSSGYMENAVLAVGAVTWEMNLQLEELEGGRYLVTHEITIR